LPQYFSQLGDLASGRIQTRDRCLEGRSTQEVNLRVLNSKAVRVPIGDRWRPHLSARSGADVARLRKAQAEPLSFNPKYATAVCGLLK
jgi:hypothetical protein